MSLLKRKQIFVNFATGSEIVVDGGWDEIIQRGGLKNVITFDYDNYININAYNESFALNILHHIANDGEKLQLSGLTSLQHIQMHISFRRHYK